MADIQLTGDFATQFFDKWINGVSDENLTYIMEFTGRAVGAQAEYYAREYPEQSGKPLDKFYTRVNAKGQTYQSKFKSLKQQRYVMALVGRGGVPYRRTGGLARSVTNDIANLTPTSVDVVVGTDRPYAPYVIGTPDEGQSHYHQGNWTPLQTNLDNHQAELNTVANDAFSKAVRNTFTS